MDADRTAEDAPVRLSAELQEWLGGGDTTLGSLVDLFGERSFALLFMVLMAVPALPLPTGGATHLFEIVVALTALQLIAGREEVWIPARWQCIRVAGDDGDTRFIRGLLAVVRALERVSRPRMAHLFGRRITNVVFGVLVVAGCVGAFLAPPFSGLDTLPAMGVLLMSLGVLLTDIAIALTGVAVGTAGVFLEVVLGKAVLGWARGLL